MCDPISLIVGAVGGLAVSSLVAPQQSGSSVAQLPDPAEERAKAEAEAAQKANAKLASDSRRRREQGSLLAKGAPPTFSFGDATTDAGTSPITSIQPVTRRTTARKASLMSQGSTAGGSSFGGGGGGGRRYSENLV